MDALAPTRSSNSASKAFKSKCAVIPNTTLQLLNSVWYYHDAAFDEHGAQHLNQRTFDLLTKKENEGNNATIATFNENDLQSCGYTAIGDGRHYHDLNLIRIRLLEIVIKELFPHIASWELEEKGRLLTVKR
ncbi:Cyclin-Dependent Kinase [Seminavis robusta]|uniref:Cyclin-Dependent Kinase n=1 Tax=Seminavis robusta TaxID=568900 RepID=A0A9N8EVC1_9STRA|nr:Cyclin-Dependent Kinase [Seminavis robusta]|eukprot:Sro1870_g302710.1 Cyclin-Dependent Kinase (132) ;mRNA; r:7184-7579